VQGLANNTLSSSLFNQIDQGNSIELALFIIVCLFAAIS
jgi:hypothetical protein